MSAHHAVSTPLAPGALGPYSQAIRAGSFLYISGQLGLDPRTGKMVDSTFAGQTRQALNNVKAIVEAVEGTLRNIVNVTVLTTSMAEFATINTVYAEYFPATTSTDAPPPARACFEVSALPKGGLVEIAAVAYLP